MGPAVPRARHRMVLMHRRPPRLRDHRDGAALAARARRLLRPLREGRRGSRRSPPPLGIELPEHPGKWFSSEGPNRFTLGMRSLMRIRRDVVTRGSLGLRPRDDESRGCPADAYALADAHALTQTPTPTPIRPLGRSHRDYPNPRRISLRSVSWRTWLLLGNQRTSHLTIPGLFRRFRSNLSGERFGGSFSKGGRSRANFAFFGCLSRSSPLTVIRRHATCRNAL